jgi:DNA polymerase III delta prime subunit
MKSDAEIYQPEAVECLRRAIGRSRLPHGIIISSPGEVGEEALVYQLARYLLCGTPAAPMQACGECSNCVMTTHPDLFIVRPKGLLRAIKTDDMLGLIQFMQNTSLSGIGKVGIIFQAETLRKESANRFLKTLEEPTNNTYFILVTTRPERLLPTIKSRCQMIRLLPLKAKVLRARAQQELQLGGDDLDLVCALARGRWRRAVQLAAHIDTYRTDISEITRILARRDSAAAGAVAFAQRVAKLQKTSRKDFEVRMKAELSKIADEFKDLEAPIRRSILAEREEQFKSEQAARERDGKAGLFEALLELWRDVWTYRTIGDTAPLSHSFLKKQIASLAKSYSDNEIMRNLADIELVRGPAVYLNARFDIVFQGLLAHTTAPVGAYVPLRSAIAATGL